VGRRARGRSVIRGRQQLAGGRLRADARPRTVISDGQGAQREHARSYSGDSLPAALAGLRGHGLALHVTETGEERACYSFGYGGPRNVTNRVMASRMEPRRRRLTLPLSFAAWRSAAKAGTPIWRSASL